MIQNNTISGGSGYSTYGINSENSSTAEIIGNTIDCGNASSTSIYCIYLFLSSPKIEDNILTNSASIDGIYGIYEVGGDPATVRNNDFKFSIITTSKLYFDGSKDINDFDTTTFTTGEGTQTLGFWGNFSSF